MAWRLGVNDTREVIGKTKFAFYPKNLAQEFYGDEQRIILTVQPLINNDYITKPVHLVQSKPR